MKKAEVSKLDKKAILEEIAVRTVRSRLVTTHPFTAGILLRLGIVPVSDCRLDTACTDGKNIFLDIDFWKSLNEQEQLFLLAHETWHCVMLHMLRRESRDPQLFNIATDMEINNILKDDGFYIIKDCLLPEHGWEGQSAEWIYDQLLKKMNQKKNSSQGQNGNKGSSGSQSNGGSGNKEIDDMEKRCVDKHVYSNDIPEKDEEGSDKDKKDGKSEKGEGKGKKEKGFDPDFNPTPGKNADEGLAEQIREAIIEEAQKAERTAGNIPASIKNQLDKFVKPEMPWKSILAQFVTSCYSESRKWYPVNRRYVWQNSYMQSRRTDRLNIAVAVDTSGSCCEELYKFYSEITSLIKSFGKYSVTLIECDAQISNVDTYTDDENPFPSFDKLTWHGGGGTNFGPVFDYIEESGIEPDALVFFTDGFNYGEELNKPPYQVLWILTKDGNRENFADFGRKTFFKK